MRHSVALGIILASTLPFLLLISAASVQAALPVPEFTLNIVDQSFDVAPTYTIDPYTGKNITASSGYRVEKRCIEVKIKNQAPYSSYDIGSSGSTKLYYNIRVKGHFLDDWAESRSLSNLVPSDSEYTIIQYGFGQNNPGGYNIWLGEIPPGGQMDFQVEALAGYYTKVTTVEPTCWRDTTYTVFTETGRSGWSPTQTIAIDSSPTPTPSIETIVTPTPETSTSPSPTTSDVSPTPTPSRVNPLEPEPTIAISPASTLPLSTPLLTSVLQIIVIAAAAVIVVLAVTVVVLLKRQRLVKVTSN